jgi:predicted ATPase
MGKSSVIQTLLLLRQSLQKDVAGGLMLNGDLCKIGSAQDAITICATEDIIDFEIAFEKEMFHSRYAVDTNQLESDLLPKIDATIRATDANLPLLGKQFQYISAYRNAISDKLENTSYYVEKLEQISGIEGRAEFVAPYINKFGDKPVFIPALKHPKEENPSLKAQIEAWLREFTPNINLHVERIDNNNYKTEFSFNRDGGRPTIRFKSKNVGFGLSYDLPLLAVILYSKPGDLIIIENPESHIHPSGQACLINLMAKAAQAGVQFIIETHSDHIINGALVSIKKGDIHCKNISVFYFDRDEEKHTTISIPIVIRETGRIYKPPKGFFEQISIDTQFLMGF